MSTPRDVRTGTGRYAAGQLLALVLVAVVALPLVPLLVLLVGWIRLRDRRAGRPAPRLAAPGRSPTPPPTPRRPEVG